MREGVEVSGRTVEDAIDAALAQLGAREDEVEIRILSEGDEDALTRGEARIFVRWRDERTVEDHALDREHRETDRQRELQIDPAEAERQAGAVGSFLEGLLDVMRIDADVDAAPTLSGVAAEISGDDLAVLIGRHGSTMGALQELSRAVASKEAGVRSIVSVDIEGYLERRTETLERMAHAAAARARKTGRGQELEPMPARDRKIVHDALSGMPGIRTESDGDEPYRFVVILPAR